MKFIFYILIFIFGSSLSAAECPPFHHWVKSHHRSAYIRSNGTHVSAMFVTGHCRVNQLSYLSWGNSFSEGQIAGWPHKEKMKPWITAEKEQLLEVVDQLPKFLSEIKGVKLYRSSQSEIKGNHGTNSNNDHIVLYDSAFKNEKLLKRVATHELTHRYYSKLPLMQQTIVSIAVGWRTNRSGDWVRAEGFKPLLPDSSISPEESFANAIETYYTEPLRLKSKAPMLHNWISTTYDVRIK